MDPEIQQLLQKKDELLNTKNDLLSAITKTDSQISEITACILNQQNVKKDELKNLHMLSLPREVMIEQELSKRNSSKFFIINHDKSRDEQIYEYLLFIYNHAQKYGAYSLSIACTPVLHTYWKIPNFWSVDGPSKWLDYDIVNSLDKSLVTKCFETMDVSVSVSTDDFFDKTDKLKVYIDYRNEPRVTQKSRKPQRK